MNKSREEDERQNAGMKGELEAALTLKQETEAKLAHAQAEIARLQVSNFQGGHLPGEQIHTDHFVTLSVAGRRSRGVAVQAGSAAGSGEEPGATHGGRPAASPAAARRR